MARRGGWRRTGSRRRFRYADSRGNPILDEDRLRRIEQLVIPPAWRDVWISPNPGAKLQATGVDAAGRRQYLYHPEYRAAREQEKFDRLVRFGELLPTLRTHLARRSRSRPVRARVGLRDRRHADQPRLVSRRLGTIRPHEPDVRDHHVDQEARQRTGATRVVPLSRQASGPGAHDARRRRAGRGGSGAAPLRRAARACCASIVTGRPRTSPRGS